MILVLIGFSVPIFWLGIILQIVFGLKLGVLPVSGLRFIYMIMAANIIMRITARQIQFRPGWGRVAACHYRRHGNSAG